MPALIRCHGCRRPLRNPPIRDHRGRPYGPKCAQERGYTAGRRRGRRPGAVRRVVLVQPPLWDDDNEEGIAMQTTKDQQLEPVAGCRCPKGWPMTVWQQEYVSGEQLVTVEHHRGLCGLPDETAEPSP